MKSEENVRDANLWNKAAGYHNSSSFCEDYSFTKNRKKLCEEAESYCVRRE